MTEREIDQMIDDGCPHVDDMTIEEVIANPDKFVASMRESRVYCIHVPGVNPTALRCMIGKDFCVDINPYRGGSIIETMCKEDFEKLRDRFYPPHKEDYDAPEEKSPGTGGCSTANDGS